MLIFWTWYMHFICILFYLLSSVWWIPEVLHSFVSPLNGPKEKLEDIWSEPRHSSTIGSLLLSMSVFLEVVQEVGDRFPSSFSFGSFFFFFFFKSVISIMRSVCGVLFTTGVVQTRSFPVHLSGLKVGILRYHFMGYETIPL